MSKKNLSLETQKDLKRIRDFFMTHNFLGFSDAEQIAIENSEECKIVYALMEKIQDSSGRENPIEEILIEVQDHWSKIMAKNSPQDPTERACAISRLLEYDQKRKDAPDGRLLLEEEKEYQKIAAQYTYDMAFQKQYLKALKGVLSSQSKQKTGHSAKAFRLIAKKKANSKLGGLPNFSEAVPWPCNDEQQPLSFVAQIDFAEVPRLKGNLVYPESGAVLFFYDPEYYLNLEKSFGKTIFVPELSMAEHAAPESMDKDFFIEQASPIGFKAFTSKETSPTEEEICEVPQHMLFGFPALIQDGDMREECVERCGGEVDDWILLLQLDEDQELSMIWGDAGRAYYWIREQDLAAADFSNTCMLIQSC